MLSLLLLVLLLLVLTAAAPVMGRASEVPGRATCATLCSSINKSATPCSIKPRFYFTQLITLAAADAIPRDTEGAGVGSFMRDVQACMYQ
jgi:hypothetical protein